jgi:hypothetical protein
MQMERDSAIQLGRDVKKKFSSPITLRDEPPGFYLKLTVEFGHSFSEEPTMTRTEFVKKLNDQSEQWKRGFIGEMMKHIASHITSYADHLDSEDGRATFMQTMIPTTYTSYYEGCGSCQLPDGRPGSNCCTVIHPASPTIVCFCDDVC